MLKRDDVPTYVPSHRYFIDRDSMCIFLKNFNV
jgi:hypothetical protein